MTATLVPDRAAPAAGAEPARLGSLLRSESRRLRSRRLVQLLFVLALLGFGGGVAIAATQYAQPSAAGLADAQRRLDQIVAESRTFHEQCLRSTEGPPGMSVEERCGPPPTAENFGRVEDFIDKRPFALRSEGLGGVVAVGMATAALAFLIGATSIGAEWSSRSLVALLFWEPRRRRVMAAKIVVVTGAAALLGLLAQGAWLVAAPVLAATRGSRDVPGGFWADLVAASGRGVVLAVLAALLGFGLANLFRNTAAALGAGFLYFAFLEPGVRVVRGSWQPWLLTDNALALVTPGGWRVYVDEGFVNAEGLYESSGREILVGNLHGGLVLAAATLAVLAVGVLLFSRRDLG